MITALEGIEVRKAPKVLIVDDDPHALNLLSDRCIRMGLDVQTANNGLQAMLMARRNSPDVMIVDVHMPELDGLSLCLRLLGSGSKSIEVIVISGYSAPETLERCESFGAVFARKGPDMWKTVQSALQEIFPTAGLKVEEIAKSPTTAEVRERPLVLLIDDDPDVVKFLEKRLRKCGVSVLSTTDGIRGYRMARREKPSVILSDYFMPEGDINFLLWRLRSTPGTEKIPVIAMTARNLDKNVEENLQKDVCGQRGVERIFRKPLDIDALFTALQQYCAVEYTATAE